MRFKIGDRVKVICDGKNYRDGEIRTVTGELTIFSSTGHYFLDNCNTATKGIVLYDEFKPYKHIKKHKIK
jgi:hypothetical protein